MPSQPLDPYIVKRKILGAWELPTHEDYSETIFLQGVGNRLLYTCSAASVNERIRQIVVGDTIHGNWHIRSERKKNQLMDSTVGGSVRGSVGGSLSFLAPRSFNSDGEAEDDISEEEDTGPFLVLNFTEFTNSILNLNLFGLRVDVANWLNNFRELVEDDCLKVISFTENDTKLTLKGRKGTVIWRKVQESLGSLSSE